MCDHCGDIISMEGEYKNDNAWGENKFEHAYICEPYAQFSNGSTGLAYTDDGGWYFYMSTEEETKIAGAAVFCPWCGRALNR